ncbi:MAG: S-layer homology domain-containing protein [Sedimentibacter sp.]|uniref:S-layer homology domain-containing protein n=1 Tax=Sedimentibacter sp. TaxID=1960295 RepID=UPI0031589584
MLLKKGFKNFKRTMSFVLAITLLLAGMPFGISSAGAVTASQDEALDRYALEAVRSSYKNYVMGTAVDGGGYNTFSSYDAYILAKAGADLSSWERSGTNFADEVVKLLDDTISKEDNASAKRVAQDYLAAKALGETERAAALIGMLKSRQNEAGELDSGAWSVYSNLPAYDLFGREGTLSGYGFNDDKAALYVLNAQDFSGAWPSGDYQDFMSTAQAVRVLKGVQGTTSVTASAISAAIDSATSWMQSRQQADGSFVDGWDDITTDTSEMIYTANVLGEDVSALVSSAGKSPVDYMAGDSFSDGNFGNISSTTWALDAYLQLGASISSDSVIAVKPDVYSAQLSAGSTKQLKAYAVKLDGSVLDVTDSASWISSDSTVAEVSSAGTVSAKKTGTAEMTVSYGGCSSNIALSIGEITAAVGYKVEVAVIGKSGDVIYGPKSVTVSASDEFGGTAMSALDATGLDWEFGDTYGFVEEIDGEQNQGLNGWMYAVNGRLPNVLAVNKTVKSGDKVLWWYSKSSMDGIPDWPSSSALAATAAKSTETSDSLRDYAGKIRDENTVLNSENKMTAEEASKVSKELADNKSSWTLKYEGKESAYSDGEVSLLMAEGSLSKNTNITVSELVEKDYPKQFAVRIKSSVYEFGPEGTKFDEPAVIGIRIALDDDTHAERLTAAYYSQSDDRWVVIPCVIDMKTGLVVFRTDHFSKFAVVETERKVSFDDVGEHMAWAKEAVEVLAGMGIINGTGNGFEPNRSITRAEFVKIISEAMGYGDAGTATGTFADLDSSQWYDGYVAKAFANGIVKGDENGNFRPQDTISRYEIAVMLRRLSGDETSSSLSFEDASDVPDWAVEGVRYAAGERLMNGYEDNTFRGSRPMSRAEVAAVMYRYMNLISK